MQDFNLDIDNAMSFYKKFILGQVRDKTPIYKEYGFGITGCIGFEDWEVFGAILLQDKKKPGYGTDLYKHEIKSAIFNGGFEYQYHKNRGLEKLEEDRKVIHIFISYSIDYRDIDVWWLEGEKLKPLFDEWEPELRENYKLGEGNKKGRQRFRKQVNYSYPKNNGGRLILRIRKGEVVALVSSPDQHPLGDSEHSFQSK